MTNLLDHPPGCEFCGAPVKPFLPEQTHGTGWMRCCSDECLAAADVRIALKARDEHQMGRICYMCGKCADFGIHLKNNGVSLCGEDCMDDFDEQVTKAKRFLASVDRDGKRL